MKKIVASIITLLLLISCCLVAAFPTSATDINYDDFDIIEGVLIEYVGPGGDVVIPSVDEDGNPVTRIDSKAFYGNTDVTSVVVPEGIEEFGNSVFEGCTNLTEVSLPYSLHTAEYNVFKSTGLMSIVIPGNLKEVPSSFVVAPCADVVISPGVEVFKAGALYVGSACTELIFPDSVYQVYAFAFCYFANDVSLYFCNPDVELGTPGHHGWSDTEVGPIIWARSGATPEIKIYSLDNSLVEEYVNEHQTDFITTTDGEKVYAKARFLKLDEDKLDEYQTICEERAVKKPAATQTPTDNSSSSGATTNTNNNVSGGSNTANAENGNGGSMLTIIIVIVAVFFLLIIIMMVVMMVMMNKKNKKKKKKKKTPLATETPEESIEEKHEEIIEDNAEE